MTHTLNGNEVLAVKVPDDASDIQLHKIGGIDEYCITYFTEKPFAGTERVYLPPPGSYSILGRGRDLKEEQWQGLVESDWWYDGPKEDHGLGKVTFYREYPKELEDSCLLSATESGLSWLKANGIDENYLLIIKK